MSKTQNQLGTYPLRISTTKAVVDYLKQLVSTGLYGRTHTEAAERLISRGIERLLQEGTLQQNLTALLQERRHTRPGEE
jgi:hypothetical protein